jgi:hypothetical protein
MQPLAKQLGNGGPASITQLLTSVSEIQGHVLRKAQMLARVR